MRGPAEMLQEGPHFASRIIYMYSINTSVCHSAQCAVGVATVQRQHAHREKLANSMTEKTVSWQSVETELVMTNDGQKSCRICHFHAIFAIK